MALSCYTLGYIYEKFAPYLDDKRVHDNPDYEDFLLGSQMMYKSTAHNYFQDAY